MAEVEIPTTNGEEWDCGAPRQTTQHIHGECTLRPFVGNWDGRALEWILDLDIDIYLR